ncbi:hypothetical protein L202_05713 [Cryptococcus amylolentus CBS 6039]|uniref:Acetyl-coenzyme A transporter 1 n=1 Tax=Cryptococcus amylolentus CBS 6039 TaxID=1295533 RepID=A0A1E3HLH3_9TREE|nr:hypothetical protein L202_05713 [Cryptococcus amylolentus CBS 6039]ODN77190.1 hypothetical protein L202_05713 [Cryptococcus amylolentus CBS 6039]
MGKRRSSKPKKSPTPSGHVYNDTSSSGMLHREAPKARSKNLEDIAQLEEQGLLRKVEDSEDDVSSPRSSSVGSTARRRRGKDQDGVRLEKIEIDEQVHSTGLTSRKDKEAFALLVLLYLLQGIPLGLTFGTLPFLLKSHLSYSQLALFALSTWPYSLKLLWSPIVDAWFVKRWGRRKSWIVPVQGVVGVGMWIIGGRIGEWMEAETVDVKLLTTVFGSLIFAAATQDIAVDGWALTLLSQPNLSYASTAQTIGIGIGNALSFTVFLAFNSADFANKYFRGGNKLDYGLISLGGYLRFWAVVFIVVTIGLAVFKTEDPVSDDDPDMDVKKVYKVMWSIVQLKNIQTFLFVHLICKIGFQVNDSVTSLKLLEKGLSKEDLAVATLLDFPAQMAVGWLAAKWSRPPPASSPLTTTDGRKSASADAHVLKPWLYAFWARLAMATIATLVVAGFPSSGVGSGYFSLIIATMLFSSLTSTVQFVGICAFHTQIADPLIGGTYMTLLNTVSNLGGTWPKPLILHSIDVLTVASCSIPTSHAYSPGASAASPLSKVGLEATYGECVSEAGKHACADVGGECVVARDGYYLMSAVCVTLGAGLLIVFILPMVRRLASLPMSAWRVKIPN